MTLPTWLTNLLNSPGKLHLTSDAVKVIGILGGLAFAIFGHDWKTGGEIALGSLGTSAGVSQLARVANK